MNCRPTVIIWSLNLGRVELGMCGTSVLSRTWTTNRYVCVPLFNLYVYPIVQRYMGINNVAFDKQINCFCLFEYESNSHNGFLFQVLLQVYCIWSIAKCVNYIIQLCSGITRRRVLDGELYAQRFQRSFYLHLFTDYFMKISRQSSE